MINMFCPECGNKKDENGFCSNCVSKQEEQNPVFAQSDSNQALNDFIELQQNKKANSPNNGIVFVVVIILVIGIGFLLARNFIFNDNEPNDEIKEPNTRNNQRGGGEFLENATKSPTSQEFLLAVEDAFRSEDGAVVTGRVERGSVQIGDEIEIIGLGERRFATVIGIEMEREQKNIANAGDQVGITLKDLIAWEDVQRGQVLAKSGSIDQYTNIKANIYILTSEEGGRRDEISSNYRPQFYFRTTDVPGTIHLPTGTNFASPGDIVNDITVELQTGIALEIGTQFSIREGGRTIGVGYVTEIIN